MGTGKGNPDSQIRQTIGYEQTYVISPSRTGSYDSLIARLVAFWPVTTDRQCLLRSPFTHCDLFCMIVWRSCVNLHDNLYTHTFWPTVGRFIKNKFSKKNPKKRVKYHKQNCYWKLRQLVFCSQLWCILNYNIYQLIIYTITNFHGPVFAKTIIKCNLDSN